MCTLSLAISRLKRRGPGHAPARRGQTFLELIVASGVILIALLPALRLTRDSLKISRNIETSSLLATLCASKMEEQLALSAATWGSSTSQGDFSPINPTIRYAVVCTDSSGSGGIPNSLLAITVTAWEDVNADSTWNTGESRVQISTKLSKMVSYEYEAKGG